MPASGKNYMNAVAEAQKTLKQAADAQTILDKKIKKGVSQAEIDDQARWAGVIAAQARHQVKKLHTK